MDTDLEESPSFILLTPAVPLESQCTCCLPWEVSSCFKTVITALL